MKIITLTLNPAIDRHGIAKTRDFSPDSVRMTSKTAAGKGVNLSRTLLSLGVSSRALAVLGSANAEDFKASLMRDRIDAIYLEVEGRIRENVTVHLEDRSEVHHSIGGFSTDDSLLKCVAQALYGMIDADTVVALSGSLPTGVSASACAEMLCEMKKTGARIIIDSRSFTLEDVKAVHPWLIKPNEEEIALYSDRKVTGLDEAAPAAAELRRDCAENVMISLGGEGAVLACADGVFLAKAPEVSVLSTVGAGDSSIAGFLAAAGEGRPDSERLRYAIACGSAACMTEGTRPPEKAAVLRLLRSIAVKEAE